MKIVSWNINSVRLRLDIIKRLIEMENPDIICLQETKVQDSQFPQKIFKQLGYEYVSIHGEKSYNGVAIISRIPTTNVTKLTMAGKDDARHIAVALPNDIELHNFYIPAGGDEPDTTINPKFKHKLDFVDHMREHFGKNYNKNDKLIILGDFNIAPYEHDVWSHKQLLKVVSHTPIEVEKLTNMKESLSWIDVARKFIPIEEKLYSWWSYRNRDWRKSNRGRRLDHIWTTPILEQNIANYHSIPDARDWEKPSDHVPIIAQFK